jgi:hypothetical protein
MSDRSSDHEDLKALWQDQPEETDPMTLEHIQAISRRLDRNELRTMLIMAATGALVFFVAGQQWQRTEDVLWRAMWALWGLGFAGCFVMGQLMIRLRRDPTEPGGVYLRRRIERSLGLASGKNFLILVPFVPWFVSMIMIWFTKPGRMGAPAPQPTPANVALHWIPVVLLAAAWALVMAYFQPRAARRLRRDLDELNASMK